MLIRIFLFIILMILTAACSNPDPYESVTIRISDVSCTERLFFNNRNNSNVSLSTTGEDNSATFDLDIGTFNVPVGNEDARQRCSNLIKLAEDYIQQKIEQQTIRVESDKNDLQAKKDARIY